MTYQRRTHFLRHSRIAHVKSHGKAADASTHLSSPLTQTCTLHLDEAGENRGEPGTSTSMDRFPHLESPQPTFCQSCHSHMHKKSRLPGTTSTRMTVVATEAGARSATKVCREFDSRTKLYSITCAFDTVCSTRNLRR